MPGDKTVQVLRDERSVLTDSLDPLRVVGP